MIADPKNINIFSNENFHDICDALASSDRHLKSIIDKYGYPPMWTRSNTFETLVHIILEQQVSLASALAALNKLREKIEKIIPERLLLLTDEELKACYFSRQKSGYARGVATAIQSNQLDLKALKKLSDEDVRSKVIALKGFGNWSADIYLMFVLKRGDVFPIGDLAAVNALKKIKKTQSNVTKEKLLELSHKWRPYRTVATMILWHYYLSERKII